MENTIPNQGNASFQQAKDLPGATAVLVLGILSLVFMGLIGLILAIIAVSKAKDCKQAYLANPSAYTLSSYKNMNGGRICAIISMSILAAVILIVILVAIVANM